MAAAVLRPNGSRIKEVAVFRVLTSLNSSSVLKKSSRLVTVNTSVTPTNDAPRKNAF